MGNPPLAATGIVALFVISHARAQETMTPPTLPLAPALAPADDAPLAEEAIPDDIVITSRAGKLYRVRGTKVGKLPTEPLASRQSITTITEQLIQDQGARDAQDLYRNISGVSFSSFAVVTARGFRQEEIFYDGLRGGPNAGFAVPQLFNVERAELLKGPAGMLYGPGAPGGLFNYVTKKPSERFAAQIRAIGGTAERYGGSAEVSGALGSGFSGRAGIFYEDRGLLRTNASQRAIIADGGVAYQAGWAKLILQATRYDMRQEAARLRGVPIDNEGNFLTDRRFNANEPNDFLRMRSDVLQGRIEGKPSGELMFDVTLRYNDAEEECCPPRAAAFGLVGLVIGRRITTEAGLHRVG